ncbi:hypothetical protein Q8F55_007292 [Vanrija albida]|uniref:Uncharacterized protein n=1 Tax=Vanrija albida TaxID=181172 RepID=A0ABR3PZI6_9TREE
MNTTNPASAVVLHPPAPTWVAPASAVVLHPPPPPPTDAATTAAHRAADCPFVWRFLSTRVCDPNTAPTAVWPTSSAATSSARPVPVPPLLFPSPPRSSGTVTQAAVSVALVIAVIHVLVALYP